jgi:adsorption protein B
MAAVRRIDDARLDIAVCSRPGPTTKSDCLNHLWRAVVAHEEASGTRFKAVVLHDAEDVVHPQELWIYDALIPRLAMVQLPVMPLPDPKSRWVSGHYLDEFAESHAKDLVVREALGAAVPSAGVACAIDRRYLGRIADAAGGQPFDPNCLTEDYELGYRIKALGGRGALVRLRSGNERVVVATREHFPASFDAAVRQKSRWLTGIALAGWDRLGWPAGFFERYMLVRDRKALLTSMLSMVAYAAVVLVLLDGAIQRTWPETASLPPLMTPVIASLLWFNAAMLAWRLAMRASFAAYGYGPVEGLRAIPRALASNFINAAAAWHAIGRYRATLRNGSALVWDKTSHQFPAEANR